MAAHVTEHIGFAYRRQIEKQMGVELPPPDENLPEDVEVQLSKLVAEAGERLLNASKGEAQQKKAQEQQQDPLVQIAMQEAQAKMQEVQRKQQRDQADIQLEAEKLKIERERIASMERQSGARIGLDAAAKRESVASNERIKGAQIGAQAGRMMRGGFNG
jgi:hypothetical protein